MAKKAYSILLAPSPYNSFHRARTPYTSYNTESLGKCENRIFKKMPTKVFAALMLPKFPLPKVAVVHRFARQFLEIFHVVWPRNLSKQAKGEALLWFLQR